MNYKKLILVGIISAFVAVLTSVMGVAGTIIGSVISSVLYNMLTEAFDQPTHRSISASFEWDIAYVFPIVVIALIQLLLIFALLSENGFLPSTFLNVYLSLQNFANNNLYRLLGIALLIISAYPLILKPEFVKKEHGGILAFVGLIFLARGFVDLNTHITDIYDDVFMMFDLPIAILAFILLAYVVVRILMSARNSSDEPEAAEYSQNSKIVHHSNSKNRFGSRIRKDGDTTGKIEKHYMENNDLPVDSEGAHKSSGINKSSKNIKFESNDLLDDFKK